VAEGRFVLRHACSGSNGVDYYDPGWGGHRFDAKFSKYGFNVEFSAFTDIDSLIYFKNGLVVLDRGLSGSAKLETPDSEFLLEAAINKLGHVEWTGRFGGYSGSTSAQVNFWIIDDQTSLSGIVAQVELIIAEVNCEAVAS